VYFWVLTDEILKQKTHVNSVRALPKASPFESALNIEWRCTQLTK